MRSRPRFGVTVVGLAVALGMLGLYLARPAWLEQMDNKVYDALLATRAGGEPSPVPVVVDIDERSLAAYGQWPWPRYLLARLAEKLTADGALAVALDILLSEPDRSSPVLVRQTIRRDFGLTPGWTGLPPELEDNDAQFARVLARTPAVLSMFLRFDDTPGENGGPTAAEAPAAPGLIERAARGGLSTRALLPLATGMLPPLPAFSEAAPVGAINVAPDKDGVIRSLPLLFQFEDRVYPNLSLRALMTAAGAPQLALRAGPVCLEAVRVGSLTIPVSPDGRMRVPFRGPRGVYPYYSAVDILEGRVPAEEVAGRIVFVGTSAAGLQDIRATPFDAVYPGVEAHAAVVDAALSGRFVTAPPWTPGAQALGILVTGLAFSLLFGLARPAVSLPLGAGAAACVAAGSYRLFQAGVFFSPLYCVLTMAAEALALPALRFWQEERQKRGLRHAFSRYVSPDVVARIVERGVDVFAGEEREVTLLFTDVRGFTTLSERLRPDQVVALLNRYFTPMTACVRDSGGTVDKFIGDAVMAFWNAPLEAEGHPERAVRAAMRMQALLTGLNPSLEAEFGVRLAIGAGVHTGRVYVGNMGSKELLNYTCIGDNVNLASRLEGMCPKYGVGLVTSGETAARLGDDLYFRRLDTIRVKGKLQPVLIGTVLEAAEAEARRGELDEADRALGLYTAGDFRQAEIRFQALCRKHPGEAKLYGLYASRCRSLAEAPPADWDGIWTFESK